jgi:ABC-type uncharacterized transport system YnjBCD permease subunit
MFEKVMHYIEWCFFIVGIAITALCLLRLIQGLVFGAICLRVCADKANNPNWYWIFILIYIVALPVMVFSIRRSWREISSYKLKPHSSGTR